MTTGISRTTSQQPASTTSSPSSGQPSEADPLGSRAAHGQAYRPEIDGLRAIAVLAVVLFHADIAPFGGGFVGVDVFFVISGFLITSIIEKDISAGRFSYARFYERRIRRIFPALAVVSLAAVAISAVLFIPTDLMQVGRSLIAMAVFASNLFFRQDLGITGYFNVGPSPQMLVHTWSLAVEEQFYLVLPPALLLAHRYAGRFVIPILVAATILSFADSVVLVQAKPTDAFYLIVPRAWELLIGSLLAVRRLPPLPTRIAREIVAAAGAALILVAVFGFSTATPFPGMSALIPCLGAWLFLYVGDQGPSVVARLLSTRPFVAVGRISYSLYLWHWPIFVATKYMAGGHFSLVTTVGALILAFAAATLSYRFVETPFRFKWRGVSRSRIFVATGAATLGLVLLGGAILANGGFPNRFDARTRELIARNLARSTDSTGDVACDNYKRDIRSAADVLSCPIGAGAAHNVFVWGDSHAGEMHPVMASLYRDGALGGRGAVFSVAPACVPSLSMERLGDDLGCHRLAAFALERALEPDIDTVLIIASAYRVSRDGELCRIEGKACIGLTRQQASDILAKEYGDYVRLLEAKGKHVVIGLSDPTYNRQLPHYEILKATLPTLALLRPLVRDDMTAAREKLAAVARQTGATIFDPRASLCEGDVCRYQDGGVSFYLDNDHVARSNLGIFRDGLRAALAGVWAKR